MHLQKHKHTLLLVAVLLIGALVRVWGLGTTPRGLSWDEAAIGYNGYAIFTTRRDEWLERLPVSFKSFGDYKAPLAIYINGFSSAVFDLTPFAVRLPFVLFSVLTMVAFYGLSTEIFWYHPKRQWYAVAATSLLATSPWAIHFGRIGFESGIALAFVVTGIYFFFKGLRTQQGWMWILSGLSLVASLYAYHSSKITVPLLLVSLVVLFARQLWQARLRVPLLCSGLISGLAVWPLLSDAIWGHGLARASTTILSAQLPLFTLGTTIARNALLHLSPGFLFLGASDSLRHSDGLFGVHFPTTVGLLVLGVAGAIALFGGVGKSKPLSKRAMLFLVAWIGVGLLPATIAPEVPHPNRSLLALPPFLLLATFGLAWVVDLLRAPQFSAHVRGSHGETQLPVKSLLGTLVGIHLLFFIAYTNHYFSRYSALSSTVFAEGYLEAFASAIEYEKGINGKPKADQILFTSEYGQPYIYALFAKKTNPIWYQGGSLSTYQFTDTIAPSDLDRTKTLIVAGQSSTLPINEAEQVIRGSDGSVRFAIYRSRNW